METTICQQLRDLRHRDDLADELNIWRVNTSPFNDETVLDMMFANICEITCDCDIEHLYNKLGLETLSKEEQDEQLSIRRLLGLFKWQDSICQNLRRFQTKCRDEDWINYGKDADFIMTEWIDIENTSTISDEEVLMIMMTNICEEPCKCRDEDLFNKIKPVIDDFEDLNKMCSDELHDDVIFYMPAPRV